MRGTVFSLDVSLPGASYLWSNNSILASLATDTAGQFLGRGNRFQWLCHHRYHHHWCRLPALAQPGSGQCAFALEIPIPFHRACLSRQTLLWQDGSTSNSFQATTSDTIYVTVTNACGSFSDSAVLQFIPSPLAVLPSDTFFCDSTELELITPGQNGVSYLWSNNSTSDTLTISSPGTYWLQATNACAVGSDSIVVSYFPSITTELGNDTNLCDGDTINLDATSPGASGYLWSDGSIGSSLSVTASGTYTVTITSGLCVETRSIEVGNDDSNCSDSNICSIFVPNVFSPNNDGINDQFLVSSDCDFTDFQLSVFNRWGNKVFETNQAGQPWDGTAQGRMALNGVYYWVISFTTTLDTERNKQGGSVSLLR